MPNGWIFFLNFKVDPDWPWAVGFDTDGSKLAKIALGFLRVVPIGPNGPSWFHPDLAWSKPQMTQIFLNLSWSAQICTV